LIKLSLGYLGTLTLSLHWMNLGNQPAQILIEDVYLLVIPSSQGNIDREEEQKRAQAAKIERLENAELLHIHGQAESTGAYPCTPSYYIWYQLYLIDDSPQSQGLWSSLTAKIINNLQVTIKNIHIRYEDKLSVPGVRWFASLVLF
jgi:vacuolar protein sorting-associated protein 13A/C